MGSPGASENTAGQLHVFGGLEQDRSQLLAYVPFNVIRKHAKEHVAPDMLLGSDRDRADPEVGFCTAECALERPKSSMSVHVWPPQIMQSGAIMSISRRSWRIALPARGSSTPSKSLPKPCISLPHACIQVIVFQQGIMQARKSQGKSFQMR